MNGYLLDTHILLWMLNDDARLPVSARQLLQTPDVMIAVSAMTLAEIAVKASIGKLHVQVARVREALLRFGIPEIAFTARHAIELANLPLHHRDPFDRMLVAQAQCEGLRLMSCESALQMYGRSVEILA